MKGQTEMVLDMFREGTVNIRLEECFGRRRKGTSKRRGDEVGRRVTLGCALVVVIGHLYSYVAAP